MAQVAAPEYWTLEAAAQVPLSAPETVGAWGPTLIVAPHPDDEALGCGGAIALLRRAGVPVQIALFTDGRGSHRQSRTYPPEKLIALRREEFIEATNVLGVTAEKLHFLELPDAEVPAPETARGAGVLATLRALLQQVQTVLVTWRGDPHCDHRAAYDYVARAAHELPVRIVEYPVWVWENGAPEDAPARGEYDLLRVDISPLLAAKEQAIQAHRSQVSELITDDPTGFTVPPALLAHFRQPWELFVTPCP